MNHSGEFLIIFIKSIRLTSIGQVDNKKREECNQAYLSVYDNCLLPIGRSLSPRSIWLGCLKELGVNSVTFFIELNGYAGNLTALL